MSLPSEQTLLITGVNGFLGLHVAREALERGYHVRGTVRSETSAAKVRDLLAKYDPRLSLSIVPDLTMSERYESAFSGTTEPITGIINVAAPFSIKVEDSTRDLLDPAIKSAAGVLEVTKRFGSNVRRVVNTSSFAAILDLKMGYRPGYTYTEEDWNPTTYEEAVGADPTTAYAVVVTGNGSQGRTFAGDGELWLMMLVSNAVWVGESYYYKHLPHV
jgi:NADPH-dependent methylglyoxal reductase